MLGNILTIALAAFATSQMAVAQPHNHGNMHRRHAALHRRHAEPKVVTQQETVATVYVDQHGKSIASDAPRTVYVTVTAPAPETKVCGSQCTAPALAPEPVVPSSAPPAPAPEPSSSSAPAPERQASSEAPVPEPPRTTAVPEPPKTTAVPEPAPEPSSSSAAPVSSAPSSSSSYTPGTYPSTGRRGISYSAAGPKEDCDAEKIARDLEKLQNFSPLRVYSPHCLPEIMSAGKKFNQQIFAGIWNTTHRDVFEQELQEVIAAGKGQWDSIHTVAVGNEAVNFGKNTVEQMIELVNYAREAVRAAGYNGPVVIADTFFGIKNNPGICHNSDYIAANCHPFFAGIPASQAAQNVKDEKALIAKACETDKSKKEIVIIETGWPTAGLTNNLAVPGVAEQQQVIREVAEQEGEKIILFSAFNEPWKLDTDKTFQAEKFWGITDTSYL